MGSIVYFRILSKVLKTFDFRTFGVLKNIMKPTNTYTYTIYTYNIYVTLELQWVESYWRCS